MSTALPEQASTVAPQVDALFHAVAGVTLAVALAVFVIVIVFVVRYRAGAKREAAPDVPTRTRTRMEIAWSVTPFVLFVAAFVWASRLYVERAQPPADATDVFIVAKQWVWTAQHHTGQREIGALHLAAGQPTRLVMTSQDAIHSFFVPAFRVKQDVLPGRYTELWFTPTTPGRYHLFCAEYCGTDHARMGGEVVVLAPSEFEQWLAAHATASDMAARGEALFRAYGCSGCHGVNATIHAPDLAGLYGKPVPLADGTTVIADERYLRDSILLPQREIAAGYAPVMPSFAGRISDADMFDLIAYIRSLGVAKR
jgi:cytochrome c oxidase subunit 2